jgi:hypothetical protein
MVTAGHQAVAKECNKEIALTGADFLGVWGVIKNWNI